MVVPTAVVQFGPYRWIRHPIYASFRDILHSAACPFEPVVSCNGLCGLLQQEGEARGRIDGLEFRTKQFGLC